MLRNETWLCVCIYRKSNLLHADFYFTLLHSKVCTWVVWPKNTLYLSWRGWFLKVHFPFTESFYYSILHGREVLTDLKPNTCQTELSFALRNVPLYMVESPTITTWSTWDPSKAQKNSATQILESWGIYTEGRFTPRGRATLLCKRLEILTCDWPKGSNQSQPLYT
jgi:hypothetical protein